MYQRSLRVLTQSESREQEERGAAVSSDATPVAKLRRTASLGEMDTSVENYLKVLQEARRNILCLLSQKWCGSIVWNQEVTFFSTQVNQGYKLMFFFIIDY